MATLALEGRTVAHGCPPSKHPDPAQLPPGETNSSEGHETFSVGAKCTVFKASSAVLESMMSCNTWPEKSTPKSPTKRAPFETATNAWGSTTVAFQVAAVPDSTCARAADDVSSS